MSEKRKDSKGRLLKPGEGQRQDGKYYYRYNDIYGNRKTVYSWRLVVTDSIPAGKTDKVPLREQERQINRDLDDGLVIPNKKITLDDLFSIHMNMRRLANSTRENYLYMWERYIHNSVLAQLDIKDIRKSHISVFYKTMSDHGLSNGTIQILHKMIYPALQVAVEDELIRKNPANGCCKDYNGARYKKYALSRQEQEYFLTLFDKYEMKYRGKYKLLFKVMFGTACRIGEIIGLTWNNVDMKNRLIVIDHEILFRKMDGKIRFYAGNVKTENGKRIIPMTEEVYECFLRLRENRFRYRSTLEVDGYSDFVFVARAGTPLYPANLNKMLKRLIEKNNQDETKMMDLPHISNHIFRHTACTRMAEAGIDPRALQYFMGHGNLKEIMKTYDHVNLERMRTQMKKMDEQQAV